MFLLIKKNNTIMQSFVTSFCLKNVNILIWSLGLKYLMLHTEFAQWIHSEGSGWVKGESENTSSRSVVHMCVLILIKQQCPLICEQHHADSRANSFQLKHRLSLKHLTVGSSHSCSHTEPTELTRSDWLSAGYCCGITAAFKQQCRCQVTARVLNFVT